MEQPNDRIFNVSQCRKYEFFDILLEAMTNAGWTNIDDDGSEYLLKSTGEDGSQNYVVQLRDWYVTSQAAGSVRTTGQSCFGVRFPLGYTGDSVNGITLARPATTYNAAFLFPICTTTAGASVYDKNVFIKYALSVSKESVCFVIIPATATGYGCLAAFFGAPDVKYTLDASSDGLVFASSFGLGYANNYLSVANNCSEIGTALPDKADRSVRSAVPIRNANGANKYLMTDIYYENNLEGVRGKINSLLFLPNTNILTGDDIISEDTNYRYKAAVCEPQGSNARTSFPSQACAYCVDLGDSGA
ncbi:MAG: hypothetical protein LBU36_02355 [Clostridiales bacterium]|jgi:hypothetical protein|nr:hypothetical protein [Clostridiales bacterium]